MESSCLPPELDIFSRRFPYKISIEVSKKLSQTRVAAKHQCTSSQYKKLEESEETGQLPWSWNLMALAPMLKGCYSVCCSRAAYFNLEEKETLQMETTGVPTIIEGGNTELFKDTPLSQVKLKTITGISNNGLISKTFVWYPVRPTEELRVWREVCDTQFC